VSDTKDRVTHKEVAREGPDPDYSPWALTGCGHWLFDDLRERPRFAYEPTCPNRGCQKRKRPVEP